MADAYRGLTIKIGGDTTKLTAALKAATKAGAETQRQLKAITKASNLDPGSLTNVTRKYELLKDRAQEAALKLKTLKEAHEQLSRATAAGTDRSVKELAEHTENAALNAQLALKRYNALNAELDKMYGPINKAARAMDEFPDDFKLSDAIRSSNEEFETTVAKLKEVGLVTDDDIDAILEMRAAWQQAFDENEAAKQVAELKHLENEIDVTTSDVRSLSTQMGKLNIPSNLAQGFIATDREVEKMDASIKDLVADAKRCDAALKMNPNNMMAAERKLNDLAQAAELARRKAELLGDKLKAYEESGVDKVAASTKNVAIEAQKATEHWSGINSELQYAKAALQDAESRMKQVDQSAKSTEDDYKQAAEAVLKAKTAVYELSAEEKKAASARDSANMQKEYVEVKQSAEEAKIQVDELASSMRNMGGTVEFGWSTVKSLGMTLSATLTPAMVALGGASISAANDMDSAYRDMRKTVNGTEQDFESLKQAAIDFSNTHVTSASQILSIQAIGGELGIATEALDTFATTVSNIDVATDLNADEAATALGQLANILDDLDESHMPAFSDSLVRLGNNGASTESQIIDIAKRIGSMGSIIGMTTPDILAWASSIASTGQNAESAGTAISKTMSNIETAVAQGGDSLDAFARTSQMSAEDFKAAWDKDPTAVLKAFVEGLKGIEESGGSADATLVDLGITSVRQKQAVEGLMQTVEGLDDNLTMSRDAWSGVSDEWGDAGDAAAEASKKAEGLSGSISRIKNAGENAASALGDALAPVFSNIADVAGKAAKEFSNADVGFRQAAAGAGLLIAAAGPALSIIGTAGTGARQLKDHLSKLNSVSANVAKRAAAMADELSGLTAKEKLAVTGTKLLAGASNVLKTALPIAAIGLAVGVVAALVGEYQKWKAEQELVAGALRDVSDIVSEHNGSVQGLGDTYATLKDEINDVYESMRETGEAFGESLDDIGTNSILLDNYIGTIERLTTKSQLSEYEQELLAEAVKKYNEITGDSVEVTDAAAGALSKSTSEIKANADAWELNARKQAYSKVAAEYMEEEARATIKAQKAQEAYNKAYGDKEKWIDSYLAGLDESVHMTREQAASLYETVSANSAEKEALDKATRAQEKANDNAQKALELSESLTENVNSLAGAMEGIAPQFEQFGTGIANSLALGISSGKVTIDQAMEFVKNGVNSAVASLPPEMQPLGLNIAELLAQGISDGSISVQDATSAMKDVADGDLSGLKDVFSKHGIECPQALADVIEQYSNLPADSTQAMKDAILLKLDDELVTKCKEAGINIDEGLAEGIRNGTLSPEASAALGQDVIDRAKEILGVHSPSTVFEAIGGDLDAGLQNGIDTGREGPISAMSSIGQALSDALNFLAPEMNGKGATASSELANGAGSNLGFVASTAARLAGNAARMGDVGDMRGKGATASGNFGSGIGSQAWNVARKAANIAANAAAMTAAGDTYRSGSHLASNFAAGINAGIGWVSRAATNIANAARSILQFSVPDKGPWSGAERGGKRSGLHLAQNFAAGMVSGVGSVSKAAETLAYAASVDAYAGNVSSRLSGGQSYSSVSESKTVNYYVTVDGRTVQANPGIEDAVQTLVKSTGRFYKMK